MSAGRSRSGPVVAEVVRAARPGRTDANDRTAPGAEPVQRSWPDPTWYGCGPASDDGLLENHVGDDRGTLVAGQLRPAGGDEPTATGEVVAVRVHPPDAEGVDGIHRPRSESGSRSESESKSEPGP